MAEPAVTAQIGEAGRSGADVRSDLWVRFEPGDGGDIEIELQSRVAPYYGNSIRAQARAVLQQLGVTHGRLQIRDEGALPFAIAARLEAAVRRAGLGRGCRALPERVPLPSQSPKDRLRRSRLYLPGSEPKYFINAGLHESDAVILDLEDAVHAAEKDSARILVRNALRAVDFHQPTAPTAGAAGAPARGACERMVRINQLPLGLSDLEEIIPEQPDLLLIPKVESAEQVTAVDRKIRELCAQSGVARTIWLMPILESALGIENAFAIATASDRIAALTIGLEDYTADLGVAKTREGLETQYARTRLVNAAKAAGVQANDSVYGDIGDMDGLRQWGERSHALGFEGMGCVHPLQVAVIHQAFAPTLEEIEKASKIVGAFEEAQQRGLAVVSLGAKMIDPPVVQRALKLVEQARRMGILKR
jgi:citrate lyase subunit beta / citryl-CoA lyase